jgi:hypothetical protein
MTRSAIAARPYTWAGIALARLASEDGISYYARFSPTGPGLKVRWPSVAAALGIEEEAGG